MNQETIIKMNVFYNMVEMHFEILCIIVLCEHMGVVLIILCTIHCLLTQFSKTFNGLHLKTILGDQVLLSKLMYIMLFNT